MYAELIGLVANTLVIALPFAAFLYGVNTEFLIRFPPFVEQSPLHTQILGGRDDVVATLQPLDSHLPERLGISTYCSFLCHSQFRSLPSVPIASGSFEGWSKLEVLQVIGAKGGIRTPTVLPARS